MADLIDRQKLLAKKWDWCDAEDAINSMPAIDAAPVVRCKNCRHSSRIASDISGHMRHCWNGRGRNNGDGFSRVHGDGYCDEGRRMDADAPERAGKDGRDG